MISIENHIGKITISDRYLKDLIANTVTGCFGVADMRNISLKNDICLLFGKNNAVGDSIRLKVKDNRIFISLHISITYGTNITAIVNSIRHKVRYVVEEATGMDVAKINISVDSITE